MMWLIPPNEIERRMRLESEKKEPAAVMPENPGSFRQDNVPLPGRRRVERYTICGIAGAENCWVVEGIRARP